MHDISFFPFSPYPGTELFNDLAREGRLPEFTDEWFLSLSYVEFGPISFVFEARQRSGASHLSGPRLQLVLWKSVSVQTLAFVRTASSREQSPPVQR